jgi:hypothetical protein
MAFNPAIREVTRPPRPFGLWLVVIADGLVALWLAAMAFAMLAILYNPIPQDFVPGRFAEPWPWVSLVLALGILLSIPGVLAGRTAARAILIGCMSVVDLVGAYDTPCEIIGLYRMGYGLPSTWTAVWSVSFGARLALLAAVSIWYLGFSRARAFFTS